MDEQEPDSGSERILIAAPVGRDAVVIARMLAEAGIKADCCADLADLVRRFENGAGAAVITEETITTASCKTLLAALSKQPPWSDLPMLVLMSATASARFGREAVHSLVTGTNVTLIDRPVRVRTLVTAVHAALRARRRQYQTRTLLAREQEARQAAETANRLKDEFMATVSHELRTPLTAILGWTRMLLLGSLAADQRNKALATIDRNARTQIQLIEDLLDFSRILAGKLRLNVVPIDLVPVIDLALESVRPTADVRGVTLVPLLATTDGMQVMGDHDRLQQIVWNLLNNAIKFTPRGGQVQVAMHLENSDLVVTVRDTGQGIDSAFLPFVFDRFRQADGGVSRKHGGLGLGLTIVKHLVEQHGGRVQAQSDGPGRGAQFLFSLPTVQIQPSFAKVRSVSAQNGKNGTEQLECPREIAGLRVLVVDDEPDSRDLVREVLEHCGAVVAAAASVQEALKVLQDGSIELLVSDIGMPNETGYDLIRRIRMLPVNRGGHIPAVALTAYARILDRTRSLAAGFDQHIAKPVEPAELLIVVAQLAARRARL